MPRGATDAASRSNQRSIELYPIATGASSTSASCQGDAIVGRRLQVSGGLLDRVQSQKDTPPGSKCVSRRRPVSNWGSEIPSNGIWATAVPIAQVLAS